MATSQSASKLRDIQVSVDTGSTHAVPAINPVTGDIAFIYSRSGSILCAIYRRISGPGQTPQYSGAQRFTLGLAAAATTPSGGAATCAHPWIVPIEDGFAGFWERKDTTVTAVTMTAGGMQIEMAKLKASPGQGDYTKYASATEGKGYVLDNTVIAGDAGGTPRAAWHSKNIVGVVYGHQQTYTDVGLGTEHGRTWSVRAAWLNFATDGKPVFITNGNRTGGSAVGEADDGGFAAGSTTYLVQNIDLDDLQATPIFTVGGGLPSCTFDMRGNFLVAYEQRQYSGTPNGSIQVRGFHGPYRSTGLDAAAIYTSTSDHTASLGNACRRPILAFRPVSETGVAMSGANYPPVLLTYGIQVPGTPDSGTVVGKTITFPLNGAAPTIASMTIPTNTNYDATAEEQTLPFAVESSFISAIILQEKLNNASGGDGFKFKIVHVDTSLPGEIRFSKFVARPERPNLQAMMTRDGARLAVLAYEGQDAAGGGSTHIYAELFQF